jgi:hypothetical protein
LARIDNGKISPARLGHPLKHHLHSLASTENKTKFLSMDDMVDALLLLLKTPAAAAKIKALRVGARDSIRGAVPQLFGFECDAIPDPQGRSATHRVKFSRDEVLKSGRSVMTCVAVIEGRERAGTPHLQVHSFYPAFTPFELETLLHSVRTHPPR